MADFYGAPPLSAFLLGNTASQPSYGVAAPSATGFGIAPSLPVVGREYQMLEDSSAPPVTGIGCVDPGPAFFWLDRMHCIPRVLELGNILTSVLSTIEIYNAWRWASREIVSALNEVGTGSDWVGLPAFPFVLAAQDTLLLEFRVSTTGAPLIDGWLTITVDTGVFRIHVTGTRVVLFPFLPESPLTETLSFRTTVLTSANGKEQRIAIRKNPRQSFAMTVLLEDDDLRRRMQTLLFGWQPGVFGIPVWFEARPLSAAVTAGDTTVQVDTQYGDFRDDELAIIWQDEYTYDAAQVLSHTDTSLTFSSPMLLNHDAGVLVMPLRTATIDQLLPIVHHPINLEELKLVFHVLDNDADLADTTAFPSHNSKVLLTEPNKMEAGTVSVGLERAMSAHDNDAAPPVQYTDWLAPRIATVKGFHCRTAQRRWEIRQLLHALRGPQVSFYLPTFYHDMIIAADVASGTSLMSIDHINYTLYINGQAPSNRIIITLNSGVQYCKEILSSAEVSPTVEQLLLSTPWEDSFLRTDVSIISYLRTARLANDDVEFVHSNTGETQISLPVYEVQQ